MRIALLVLCGLCLHLVAAEKELGPPHPIPAAHWSSDFAPGTSTLVGSYVTVLQRGERDFVAFNNSVDGSLAGGLQMWTGDSPTQFALQGVVFKHEQITDVFGKEGELFAKRRLTRPFIAWHPRDGFVGVIHVCADYGPIDGRVYPALVTSPTGAAGTWTYHGKLKGEIWDLYGDQAKERRWADGGGFLYQPELPAELNPAQPLRHRYVFFSNQYPGDGCMAILYSADGATWRFHRDAEGKIVNLTPMYAGRGMIFPHVVPMGAEGWTMFLAEKWPPVAIYRLWSPDGLTWQPFGEQPEVTKPEDLMIKNLNGWYDPVAKRLHGYLSVWEKQPDGTLNYNKYHATTDRLRP
jgi:hypothetical protein